MTNEKKEEKEINPLLVILQPRDIPQFVNHFYKEMGCMKYDRLIIKYTKPDIAYHAARKIFLERPEEYTHYVYGTDDIIFSEEDIDVMLEDYQHHLIDQGLENVVMASDMNLDMEDQNIRGFQLAKYKLPVLGMGISHTTVQSLITRDMYHFADIREKEVQIEKAAYHLVRCSWSALSLAIIPRYVIEHTSFDNDLQHVNSQIDHVQGCCIDLIFAIECAKQGIPIYTDTGVFVLHLKPSVAKNLWFKEYNKVGFKPPEWYILKADTDERIDIEVV